eukprot:TRINITY_DN68110_c6_g10_i2.p1 TRINITY_DN68110_c6_g10~~TRINITY_DN68110_c6_g10_i2.p1  ORF type:complete len:137 (+),score=3.01 TRINITY_DN68110_c6_g10_i2:92-502(+)
MRYYVFLAMVALVVGESIPVLDENDRVVQMIDSGLPDEVLVLDENDKPISQKFSSQKPLSLSDSPSDWPDTMCDLPIKTGTTQVVRKNKASQVRPFIHMSIFLAGWFVVVMPQPIAKPIKWRFLAVGAFPLWFHSS